MSQYVSAQSRMLVAQRADFRCEYCKIHEDDMVYAYQVDHIISIKHGGSSDTDNLAFACSVCNQNKGTDIATRLLPGNRIVRLFNPRKDRWAAHFFVQEGEIIPQTKIGEATVKVLDLNHPDRIILRRLLIRAGRYQSL